MSKLGRFRCVVTIACLPLVVLSACGGGVVGTGTGPKDDTLYQLDALPERISPDIPQHIQTAPMEPSENEGVEYQSLLNQHRSHSFERASIPRAESWEELNSQLLSLAFFRLDTQHSIVLLDNAFNDILSQCESQTDCVIPAGDIQVQYTQPVVNRLIKQFTDTLGQSSEFTGSTDDGSSQFIADLSELLDTVVVFGETRYSPLDGAPYDHRIVTSFTQTDAVRNLVIEWRDDKSALSIVSETEATGSSVTLDYFYQSGSPAENVVARFNIDDGDDAVGWAIKIIGNDPTNAGILIEAVSNGAQSGGASSSSTSSISNGASGEIVGTVETVFEESSSYSFSTDLVFQGQIDNTGGYVSVQEINKPIELSEPFIYQRHYRETFDAQGYLLAGEVCALYTPDGNCDNDDSFESYGPGTAALVDSSLFYQSGEYEMLESAQDAIVWQVVGLPEEVREFAVIPANSAEALSDREFLCVGYQAVPGDVQLFCGATDEQLSNVQIIEIGTDDSVLLIVDASLEPVS